MAKQTFAEYLVNHILPSDIKVSGPITKKEFNRLLEETYRLHQEDYKYVVMDIKNLGDKLSFLEGISVGMEDIEVPNKPVRDRLINTAIKDYAKATTEKAKISILEKVQDAVAKNDLTAKNDTTMMVTSGAMAGKKGQIMKLRSSPVVLKDHKGALVPEIVKNSYAEGLGVLDYWHGAAEARSNLMAGQLGTSLPGVFSKATHNLMSSSVISEDDCHTTNGIQLNTKDESIIDRYLATDIDKYKAGALVTPEMQQHLLKKHIEKVIVRSPQTCEAVDNTVCSKCHGLSIAKKRDHSIGDNVGALAAGSLSEVSQQLVLSSKHATTLAKKTNDLEGFSGLNLVTEMPKIYPNKQILCEVYGKVYRILMAPQGGKFLQIQMTQKVPDRYIIEGTPVKNMGRTLQYYIPPNRKLLKGIKEKAEVTPGEILTDGNPNLKDIARLRNLGAARSAATELIDQVYKNTGNKLDRRNFELLAKSMFNYVKIEKAPKDFLYNRGEVISYNKFKNAVGKGTGVTTKLNDSIGKILAEDVHHFTVGTEITPQNHRDLQKLKVKEFKTTPNIEISTVVTPLTRVQLNDTDGFISALNHRYLKRNITEAATEGQTEKIHGYNPVLGYAYGTALSDIDSKNNGGRY